MTSVAFVGVTGPGVRGASLVGGEVLAGVEVPAATDGVGAVGGGASALTGTGSTFSCVVAIGEVVVLVPVVGVFDDSSSSKSEADKQPKASKKAAKPVRFRFFFGVVGCATERETVWEAVAGAVADGLDVEAGVDVDARGLIADADVVAFSPSVDTALFFDLPDNVLVRVCNGPLFPSFDLRPSLLVAPASPFAPTSFSSIFVTAGFSDTNAVSESVGCFSFVMSPLAPTRRIVG